MSAKRVLVIGATGAMGQYVVPELAALGYEVDAVALDLGKSELPNVHYFQGNAWDKDVASEAEAVCGVASIPFSIFIFSLGAVLP